jgi:iron complex outermembrane receptor protein
LNRALWNSVDDVVHQALFGQLNFRLTDELEFTMEARQNKDNNLQVRATYTATSQVANAANPVPCSGNVEGQVYFCPENVLDLATSTQRFAWKGDIPTYKVGLNWEPADGHFLYAFLARGYKSGQSTAFTASPIVEEVVDDVEIGWKGTLRPGLYAEVGIYSMDYTDMQLSTFQTADFEARQATRNIGDSTIEGIEGSIRAVFGGFGINASVNYTDSQLGQITTLDTRALQGLLTAQGGAYPGDVNKGCTPTTQTTYAPVGSCFDYSPYFISFSGAENPFSPKITYNIGIDYAFQLDSGATITPALSFNHADSTYTNTLQSANDRYYRTDDRDVMNFSVTFENDDWNVQLFATNVTDELFIEGHSNTAAAVFYGDPRVVGIRARMTF